MMWEDDEWLYIDYFRKKCRKYKSTTVVYSRVSVKVSTWYYTPMTVMVVHIFVIKVNTSCSKSYFNILFVASHDSKSDDDCDDYEKISRRKKYFIQYFTDILICFEY